MQIRHQSCLLGLAITLTCAAAVCQSTAPNPAKAPAAADPGVLAAERWIGRALIVRGFWASDDLNFDATGNPIVSGKVTDWTLAGFDLQSVKRIAGNSLELNGVRVAARWNPDQRIFERHLLKAETMRIAFPAPTGASLETTLAAIFSIGIDPALQRSMPPYWSHYFLQETPWPPDGVSGKTVLAVGAKPPGEIVYPEILKKDEPGFTAAASADHVKGTVRVGIDVDESGLPERVTIRQPLGYGLDQKAVEAIQKYRFRPGTIGGTPAIVEIVVNQAFE